MTETIILGIDPGYDRVGWCVGKQEGQHFCIVESGCVETRKTDAIIQRFQQIDEELTQVIHRHKPTECGIESLFFENNAKTAMRVSEARGVIISCLFRNHVEVHELTPLQIKSALTGNGKATKQEVKKMVQLLTKCEILPKLDDEVDAIAAAIAHGARRKLSQYL